MTVREELYKIYNEYHNVESHEDAGMMIEFTEKNIAVITKKLDERISAFKTERAKTKANDKSSELYTIMIGVLREFKKELEK